MYTYPIKPDELYHYGIKRRSGRYPYGSGDRPYQRAHNKFQRVMRKTEPKFLKAEKKLNEAEKKTGNDRDFWEVLKYGQRWSKYLHKISDAFEDYVKKIDINVHMNEELYEKGLAYYNRYWKEE